MDLLLDALVIGVLLGCFYGAVSLGLSVSFGLLDVPHGEIVVAAASVDELKGNDIVKRLYLGGAA